MGGSRGGTIDDRTPCAPSDNSFRRWQLGDLGTARGVMRRLSVNLSSRIYAREASRRLTPPPAPILPPVSARRDDTRSPESEKDGDLRHTRTGADAHTHTRIKAGVATLSPSFPRADTEVAAPGVGRRRCRWLTEEINCPAYPRSHVSTQDEHSSANESFIPGEEEVRRDALPDSFVSEKYLPCRFHPSRRIVGSRRKNLTATGEQFVS